MRKLLPFALILLMASCYQGDTADLIIHNAQIYSCDKEFKIHQAMAIRDGKIIQLGPEREILNGYKCKNIINAEMKTIFPGFHDAHGHFLAYAESLHEVDLTDTRSFDEVVERIIEFEKTNKEEWIKGRGWDQTRWEQDDFPTNQKLNELFPDKPILIRRIDGHAALANQKALDIAGLTVNTVIEGGQLIQANGVLTGVVLDNAYNQIAKHIPEIKAELKLNYLKEAEYNLFEVGLTSINDAGTDELNRDLFIQWYQNKDLLIKNYLMLFPTDDNIKYASENGKTETNNLQIKSFKIIADGALGSRGACLIHPYSDMPNQIGFMLKDTAEIKAIAMLAKELNYQVNTHCIGDSANRMILNIYSQVIQNIPDHRWKIEHAQVIDANDFALFEALKIIPSVQPTHCTSDMRWATQRLGSKRVKYAYAYKTLLDKVGIIALGTDFPIENINPLETFYAAITRQNKEGEPEDGFNPSEKLTREEALRGITIWPAYSNFQNHAKGSLEPGKDADFVILTKDIMKVPAKEVLTTFVIKTFLNGQMVFDAE